MGQFTFAYEQPVDLASFSDHRIKAPLKGAKLTNLGSSVTMNISHFKEINTLE